MSCGTKRMHLQPQNYTKASGTDSVGAYTSATVLLAVKDPGECNGTRFEATFKHYTVLGAVIFQQSFPDGLPAAKTSAGTTDNVKLETTDNVKLETMANVNLESTDNVNLGLGATLPPGLQSAFPLWEQPDKPTGWLTWGGMFMGASYGVVPGVCVSLSLSLSLCVCVCV